jgi:hypothetical protein
MAMANTLSSLLQYGSNNVLQSVNYDRKKFIVQAPDILVWKLFYSLVLVLDFLYICQWGWDEIS